MTLPKEFLNRHMVGAFIVLGDGRQMPADFYGDIYDHAHERIPTLLHGHKYKAEHITGPNFWVPLPPVLASMAGRCIHDMAVRGLLPLAIAVGYRGVTLRYVLR